MPGFKFSQSAARHGYTEADALHAMLNTVHGPLRRPSRTSDTPSILWVRPPCRPDSLAPLIEVLVEPRGHDTAVIYHVIAVQQQTLDLFPTTRD